jgi:hypothetical protein
MSEYTDEQLIARAIENGWEQLIGVTDRFPGNPVFPWTGWVHDGCGTPVRPGETRFEWIGDYRTRRKVTYVDSWARLPRQAFSHEDRCQECGKWIEYGGFLGYEVWRAPLPYCWHCKFWIDRIERKASAAGGRKSEPFVSDDFGYYGIGTATTPSNHNGFGGSWFTVTFHDGRVVETCDLWSGGSVPERFRDRLVPTASFRHGRVTRDRR